MPCEEPIMKISVELADLVWQCGDCGNKYDFKVKRCPNLMLDIWVVRGKIENECINNLS